MFSYEEIIDISKKYRFKLDYNTKQYSVVNTDTGEKLTDSEETNKIKGLLYAPKNMSEEQKSQLLVDEFKKLQESLIQIGLKGTFTFTMADALRPNPTVLFLRNAIPSFDPYIR